MNTRYGIYLGALVLSGVLPIVASAACIPLIGTLQLGTKSEEVRMLQQFLNTRASTTVAYIGSGSIGNETNYFGPATKNAVVKFQTIFANEVLVPAGLSEATGIVGKFSREEINKQLCAQGGVKPVTTTTVTQKAAQENFAKEIALRSEALAEKINALRLSVATNIAKTQSSFAGTTLVPQSSITPPALDSSSKDLPLQIFTIDPFIAKIGDRVTIKGTGIVAGTSVRIGGTAYPLTIVSDGSAATFEIKTGFPLGKYYATLENSGKKSNDRVFVVVADTTKIPVIEGISPDTGNIGTTITLTGQNFAAKNDIFTSIGTIYDVRSSDGKTLSFPVTADTTYLNNNGKIIPYLAYFVAVVNENGISGFKEFKIR
ncbi:MAG TPA: IPT/TIG domain-containing protein [Candidatus Paceibacterota bacterium]|nr:IPT/TIG domain-containing protein [Candidatus Paceibacterota bacterium]